MNRYVILAVALVALGGFAVWVAAANAGKTASNQQASAGPSEPQQPDVPPDESSVERVRGLAQRGSVQSMNELIQLYGKLGSDPAEVPAKTLALSTILSEPQVGLRLQNLFAAIAADETPPESDPMWSKAVESMADVWKDPESFKPSRDLLFMEKRSRPRRLLLEGLALFTGAGGHEKLTQLERNGLTHDLIDNYFSKDPSDAEKEAIEEVLRDMGQPEVASALTDDFGPNSKHPAIVEYLRQLEAAEKEFGITPPPGASP